MANAKSIPKSKEDKSEFKVKMPSSGRPSKAILEMIREYQIEKDDEWLENDLDTIFLDKIDDIISMMESIKKYKDKNVYKTIPSKIKKKMTMYGESVKDYYGQIISEKSNRDVVVIPCGYDKCRICGEFKGPREFTTFGSEDDTSKFYHKVGICQSCTEKMFDKIYNKTKDLTETYVIMCQKLDIVCMKEVIDMVVGFVEEGRYEKPSMGYYLQKFTLYSTTNLAIPEDEKTFEYSNIGGIPFKKIRISAPLVSIYNDTIAYGDDNNDTGLDKLKKNKKEVNRLKDKWGNNTPVEDLFVLEKYWDQWYDTSDGIPDGKTGETMIDQLCYMQLQIDKAKAEGNNISKMAGDFRKFLKECGVTGKKKNKENKLDFGTMILEWEKKEAIPEIDEEFRDIDNMDKITTAFIGAMSRTLGKPNSYTEKFEEIYADSTINIEDIISSDISSDISDINE